MRTYQKLMQRKTALKNVLYIAAMTIRELALPKIAKSNFFTLLLKRQLKKLSFFMPRNHHNFNSIILYFSICLNNKKTINLHYGRYNLYTT
ncbi:hypothetical protein DBR27_07370, partial [Flavobacterium sp. HMWF030]